MDWLNLHTSVLDDERLATAEDAQRGVWLHLMRYCIGQENNGKIRGAKTWAARKWLLLCRVELPTLEGQSLLWQWDGDDLTVWGYPKDKQKEVQAKREGGRRGGISSGQARAKQQSSSASSKPSTTASTEGERKEKGKEKKKGRGMAAGAARPHSLEECVLYFKSIGGTAETAGAFYDHFEANGWRQGGRTPLRNWHAAGSGWLRKEASFAKKSGVNGNHEPALEFDPSKPNAHTGGIRVAN